MVRRAYRNVGGCPKTRAAGPYRTGSSCTCFPYKLVARRWRSGCSAGYRADSSAGGSSNGSTRTTASRSPNGRPCSCTEQTAAQRALARIIRICASRDAQDQAKCKGAGCNDLLPHFTFSIGGRYLGKRPQRQNGSLRELPLPIDKRGSTVQCAIDRHAAPLLRLYGRDPVAPRGRNIHRSFSANWARRNGFFSIPSSGPCCIRPGSA